MSTDRLYLCDGTRYRLRIGDATEVVGTWRKAGHFEVVRRGVIATIFEQIVAVRRLSTHAHRERWFPLDHCFDSRHDTQQGARWSHPYRRGVAA